MGSLRKIQRERHLDVSKEREDLSFNKILNNLQPDRFLDEGFIFLDSDLDYLDYHYFVSSTPLGWCLDASIISAAPYKEYINDCIRFASSVLRYRRDIKIYAYQESGRVPAHNGGVSYFDYYTAVVNSMRIDFFHKDECYPWFFFGDEWTIFNILSRSGKGL
jgi:hypothetical protein